MHDLSASATGSPGACPFGCPLLSIVQVSLFFERAVVSPVKLLSSISRSTAEISLTSAGTRSPVVKVTRSPGTSSLANNVMDLPSLREVRLLVNEISVLLYGVPNQMAVVRYKFVQRFQTFLGPLFLHKSDWWNLPCKLNLRWLQTQKSAPVRTIRTATVMLTASSMLPMRALTSALPHSKSMSGLSYIVFANLRRMGSGVSTANSLYPWDAKRDGIAEEVRPSVDEVPK